MSTLSSFWLIYHQYCDENQWKSYVCVCLYVCWEWWDWPDPSAAGISGIFVVESRSSHAVSGPHPRGQRRTDASKSAEQRSLVRAIKGQDSRFDHEKKVDLRKSQEMCQTCWLRFWSCHMSWSLVLIHFSLWGKASKIHFVCCRQ